MSNPGKTAQKRPIFSWLSYAPNFGRSFNIQNYIQLYVKLFFCKLKTFVNLSSKKSFMKFQDLNFDKNFPKKAQCASQMHQNFWTKIFFFLYNFRQEGETFHTWFYNISTSWKTHFETFWITRVIQEKLHKKLPIFSRLSNAPLFGRWINIQNYNNSY